MFARLLEIGHLTTLGKRKYQHFNGTCVCRFKKETGGWRARAFTPPPCHALGVHVGKLSGRTLTAGGTFLSHQRSARHLSTAGRMSCPMHPKAWGRGRSRRWGRCSLPVARPLSSNISYVIQGRGNHMASQWWKSRVRNPTLLKGKKSPLCILAPSAGGTHWLKGFMWQSAPTRITCASGQEGQASIQWERVRRSRDRNERDRIRDEQKGRR